MNRVNPLPLLFHFSPASLALALQLSCAICLPTWEMTYKLASYKFYTNYGVLLLGSSSFLLAHNLYPFRGAYLLIDYRKHFRYFCHLPVAVRRRFSEIVPCFALKKSLAAFLLSLLCRCIFLRSLPSKLMIKSCSFCL